MSRPIARPTATAVPVTIAILTPLADYPVEWRWAYDVEAGALRDADAQVIPICWDQRLEAGAYDLVLPLVAWGYHKLFEAWLKVLDRLEQACTPVYNPVPLLRWNSDKRYLAELSRAGAPTVPTELADRLDEEALAFFRDRFGTADLVVKPPVSASAYRTFRIRAGDPVPDVVRGRRMMVQPWLSSITDTGEWSLIFFNGEFSHCVAKVPQAGEFRVQPEHGGIIAVCEPPPGAQEVARAALAAAPSAALYARVDIVVGNCGTLQVMELELIEPALFIAHAPHAAASFAAAVLSAVDRPNEQPLADR